MNLKNARNMFKKTKNWKKYTQKTSHNDSELFWKNLTQYCFPTLISVQHYTENYKIQMSHNSNCVGHSVSAMALHGAGWSKCMDNSWFQFHPSSVATVYWQVSSAGPKIQYEHVEVRGCRKILAKLTILTNIIHCAIYLYIHVVFQW
jgi:hypothetical protein